FLGAGSVIHAMHHEQDMRRMGGLADRIPITWAMMLIGTLALTGVGIPGLIGFAGFHSKDAIVEAAWAANTPGNYAFWLLVIAALITSFYSLRLFFWKFYGQPRWNVPGHSPRVVGSEPYLERGRDHGPHESPPVMLVPLAGLAVGAVVAG